MTAVQIKFLKSIYKSEKTAKELCEELRIKSEENDVNGGYYNALNRSINYNTSDDGNEIDDMFSISAIKDSPIANNDIYIITKEGRKYIENYMVSKKNNSFSNYLAVASVVIAIIAIIVSVL